MKSISEHRLASKIITEIGLPLCIGLVLAAPAGWLLWDLLMPEKVATVPADHTATSKTPERKPEIDLSQLTPPSREMAEGGLQWLG